MRAVETESLRESMKIARTIFDDDGRVLLSAGAVLTNKYIRKLCEYGIPFIYIEDELIGPIEVSDIVRDRVRLQTVKVLKQVAEAAKMKKEIDIKPLSTMVNTILDDLKGAPDMLVQLMDIRSSNFYLYNHSIAVCALSIITGMALGLDELKIKILGMGAILHDIGKSLSEGPEHTIHGFEILRNNKTLNVITAHVAYQHHERYDGKGFPRQLAGEDIHLFAAITAVADCYDKMVSRPSAAERLYPYQALEMVISESGRAFHPEIVRCFAQNIAPYPVGTAVRLNTRVIGVVIAVPKEFPTRPIIKQITDSKGNLLKVFPVVNLLREKTLFINDILSEKERQEIANIM